MIIETLIAEYEHECANTRKVLELVPTDKAEWRPHAKSYTLWRLAVHIAGLPGWISPSIDLNDFDMATYKDNPPTTPDRAALLAYYDAHVVGGLEVLKRTADGTLNEMWSMRDGDVHFMTMPKGPVLRNFVFNHIVHHRAQLEVYLRMLDVPLPFIYGPTADTEEAEKQATKA